MWAQFRSAGADMHTSDRKRVRFWDWPVSADSQRTKLLGTYDSQVVYGHERTLVVWTRLIFSDGSSINMQGMPGEDNAGNADFDAKVNNHYAKVFGSTLLMAAFSAGISIAEAKYRLIWNAEQPADDHAVRWIAARSDWPAVHSKGHEHSADFDQRARLPIQDRCDERHRVPGAYVPRLTTAQ